MACLLLPQAAMTWLNWILLIVGLVGLFAAWDLIFCAGKYCRRFGGAERANPRRVARR